MKMYKAFISGVIFLVSFVVHQVWFTTIEHGICLLCTILLLGGMISVGLFFWHMAHEDITV